MPPRVVYSTGGLQLTKRACLNGKEAIASLCLLNCCGIKQTNKQTKHKGHTGGFSEFVALLEYLGVLFYSVWKDALLLVWQLFRS